MKKLFLISVPRVIPVDYFKQDLLNILNVYFSETPEQKRKPEIPKIVFDEGSF